MESDHGRVWYDLELYKYLAVLIDDQLPSKLQKLKLKIGFYSRNTACFSLETQKRLVAAAFLTALSDSLYRNAPDRRLSLLDTVYRSASRFGTGCKALAHRCTLYTMTGLLYQWGFLLFIFYSWDAPRWTLHLCHVTPVPLIWILVTCICGLYRAALLPPPGIQTHWHANEKSDFLWWIKILEDLELELFLK